MRGIQVHPFTVGWHRLRQQPRLAFLAYVLHSFFRHDCPRSAAYLAFMSLFAVVPVMTVVYSILALVPQLKGMDMYMQQFVFEHFVPATGNQLADYLQGFARQAANLTSAGVLMLFVTSVLMLRKIETSFNTIWHVSESRKGVAGFLLYWALLTLGPVLMGGAFAVSSYLASLELLKAIAPLPGAETLLLNLLPLLMSSVAFSLTYIAIPNTRVPIRHGIIGGVAAALLFDLARRGVTLFITLFPTYHLVYGAFAAVPVFLLWVLVSWFILLFGAEIVQALTHFRNRHARSASSLGNLLSILHRLYRQQAEGCLPDESRLAQDMPWIDHEEWEKHLDLLERIALVQRDGQGRVGLIRDLHKYSLARLVEDCWGSLLALDLRADRGWQARAVVLHRAGLEQGRAQWQLDLASLFDTPDTFTTAAESRMSPPAACGE